MPADDYTDDYVAELLKRDAKVAASSSTSTSALGSLLSKRPTGAAPKPNTRFLKNLIRHTDTHNAAVLAREAEESRARLSKLRQQDHRSKSRPEQTLYSARARREGGQALQPPTKKRRLSYEPEDGRERKSEDQRERKSEVKRVRESKDRRKSTSPDRRERKSNIDHDRQTRQRSTSPRHDQTERSTRTRHDKREDSTRTRHDERERSPTTRRDEGRRHRRRRSTSRSTSSHRDEKRDQRGSHRYRPSHIRHSPSRSHSPSPHRKRHDNRPSHRSSKPTPKVQSHTSTRRPPSPSSDSDPLEAFLGPLPAPADSAPPVRSRGRRAYAPSTIDAHFASTYDPTADTDPDHSLAPLSTNDPENDWEAALEAMRDRQKWRQQGADRLRAAGFTEAEVHKWERTKVDGDGNRVMDEEDLKWSKNGEAREWDRGKVVDDEQGVVHIAPEWGRLKGT